MEEKKLSAEETFDYIEKIYTKENSINSVKNESGIEENKKNKKMIEIKR